MPPLSSLVFVIILAVWAVYLVQHWVRRRDHLATARSVDRFSEAMRVLERRRTLRVPEVEAQPRSYAASPLRPSRPGRPEVVVKRRDVRVAPDSRGTRAARGPGVTVSARGATAVAPSRDHRRSRGGARLRAAGLLAGSLTMVALVGLAVSGQLPRWSALAGVGVCAVTFALVRWSVARQRAARISRTTTGPSSATAARPASGSVAMRHHHPSAEHHRADHEGHEFAAQSMAATLRTASRRAANLTPRPADASGPQLYDVHAVEASLAEKAASAAAEGVPNGHAGTGPLMDEQSAPPLEGTWDPVPVPPPTYTLKAKAYRGMPAVSTSLPADGTEMALEEEFEELPRVDRVG